MKNINLVYLNNGFQFTDEIVEHHNKIGWLGREPLPLELLCQFTNESTYDSDKYNFNVVHNFNGELPEEDAINLFPIDFQSFPIAYEGADQTYSLSDFGKLIDEKIKECVKWQLPNTVFLVYTSTEPYFFDANMYFVNLSEKYPDAHFILSGSGETEDYFGNYDTHLKQKTNVSKIHKLWYLDRVHYITTILGKGTHVDLNQTVPPENSADYIDVKNRFLLTMRNCRSHRLLISYFMETKGKKLEDITYSRNYSMSPNFLSKITDNPETKEEFPYHMHLMTTAMHELLLKEKLTEKEVTGITHTIYSRPHVIDLKDLNDRGVPGPWLYDTGFIALIPGGEPYGYGYVDEKQMFPMYFNTPFITVGCQGLYEELERLNFKTFGRFWDTSFNKADTLKQRVQGFYKTICDLRDLNDTQFAQLIDSLKNDVSHNYKNITTGRFRRLSNDHFLKELIDACS